MQQLKEGRSTAAMMGVSLAVLAALLMIAFAPEEKIEISPVLGEKGEWAVYRGAAALEGAEITLHRKTLLQGALLLVNREHPLPADFPLPNTRTLRAMVGYYLPVWEDTALRSEAVYALCEMKLDYSLDSGITFTRGCLSAAQLEAWQKEAFDRYVKVYSLEDALHKALKAVPGGNESEHRTGYALDVELHPPLSLGQADPLRRNNVGMWLYENMWKYGWIYCRESDGAGACEGIHLRYVGKIHAAAMHTLDLGLEEYLTLLRTEGQITLYQAGEAVAFIHCRPCEEDWEMTVPEVWECEASYDNTGWAVAAIYPTGRF